MAVTANEYGRQVITKRGATWHDGHRTGAAVHRLRPGAGNQLLLALVSCCLTSVTCTSLTAASSDSASTISSAEKAVEVLIIGAGVSGLTSAYELLNAGVSGANIAIIEQRHQPGGRTINIDVPGFDGKKVEAGGTWIGGTQDRVASLARELGLTPEGKDFFHTCTSLATWSFLISL